MHVDSKKLGLRAIALFEMSKGLLVFLLGLGLLEFHQELKDGVQILFDYFRIDSTAHYSHLFLKAIQEVDPENLRWLAVGTSIYALIRFVEAYGLWRERRWAEWLAVVSAGLYLPFEVYEVWLHGNFLSFAALTINLLILGFLLWQQRQN